MKLNIKAIKDGIIFYLEENSWIHQYGGIEYQGESPAACIAWAYNNNFLIINR